MQRSSRYLQEWLAACQGNSELGTFWKLPAILPKCQLLICTPMAARVPEPFH